MSKKGKHTGSGAECAFRQPYDNRFRPGGRLPWRQRHLADSRVTDTMIQVIGLNVRDPGMAGEERGERQRGGGGGSGGETTTKTQNTNHVGRGCASGTGRQAVLSSNVSHRLLFNRRNILFSSPLALHPSRNHRDHHYLKRGRPPDGRRVKRGERLHVGRALCRQQASNLRPLLPSL